MVPDMIEIFLGLFVMIAVLAIAIDWNKRSKKRAQLLASRDSALAMLYSKSPLSDAEYFRRRVELARQVH